MIVLNYWMIENDSYFVSLMFLSSYLNLALLFHERNR